MRKKFLLQTILITTATTAMAPMAAVAAVTCETGYDLSAMITTNIMTTLGGDCPVGFGRAATDGAYFFTDDICAPGEYKSGNTCVALTTDACASGMLHSQLITSNIGGTAGGTCGGGALVSNNGAYFMPDALAPCETGYQRVNGECVAYATGNGCPTNYYTPNERIIHKSSSACASGYVQSEYDYCRDTIGEVSGYLCTPQRKCTIAGADVMKSTTGLQWQLYDDMLTIPSLTTEHDNGAKCHMNLLPGYEADNLIIEYNNITYHGVK